MRHHPHRPDWIALILYTATFTAIVTVTFSTAAAIALIGRLP